MRLRQMEAWKDSRTPALAIVARGDQVSEISPVEFMVRSQSRPEVQYRVKSENGRWKCECQFHAETGLPCVHILSVRFRAGFQESKVPTPDSVPTCEKCRSTVVVRTGVRRNKSGAVRRYLCRTCGASFCGKEGYLKRRSDPELIAKALDLYFRGVSLRQVAAHFGQAYGLSISPMTVYRWIVHYSKLAAEWMDRQGAKVGQTWHADERVVNVNGEHRYLWNVMDSETRFLLASTISKGRSVPEARAAFQAAKNATEAIPTEIRTDGLYTYRRAISKEFGGNHGPGGKHHSPHRVVPSIRAPESNNLLERLNGTEKDRTKTMRAYDNDRGAAALSEGWRVHYDMVRDHIALGTTPAVAAGLPAIPGFRWAEIIKQATRKDAVPVLEAN